MLLLDLAALGEDHLRPRGAFAVGLLEHELVVLLLVARRDRLRQRLGARGVAEREVALLDREDVREVGPELQRELEGDRLHRLVLDDHVVLHAVADEAVPDDRERVLRQAAGERVAQEEGRREVLDLARREQQRRGAVDGQAEPREEARVVGEQALRLAGDVATLVADAEGRAFEDRQGHQASRTIRAGRRLRERLDHELVDVHVRRPSEREEHALGDVVGRERLDVRVDGARLLLVAAEADAREVRLDEARVDRREADRTAEQVLAQRVGEAAHGELRGDVDGGVLVRLAPGDRAHVDDVAAVADVRQAEARHPQHAVHVRLEHGRLVLLAARVEGVAAEAEAGVVDEDVEPAERLDRRVDEALAARGVASRRARARPRSRARRRGERRRRPSRPLRASARAVAAPIPLEAPVTIAVLPSSAATD